LPYVKDDSPAASSGMLKALLVTHGRRAESSWVVFCRSGVEKLARLLSNSVYWVTRAGVHPCIHIDEAGKPALHCFCDGVGHQHSLLGAAVCSGPGAAA